MARFAPPSGVAVISVTDRPNDAPDLVFERNIGSLRTVNRFMWDGSPAAYDQLWITLATVEPPPTGFFELHSGSEIYLRLRDDFWSDEQNEPPEYFPAFGPMPRYFITGDIHDFVEGSAFQGRIVPSDPFTSYGFSNFSITTSAEYGRYADVPLAYWSFLQIEKLSQSGITVGCGGGSYCPLDPVTRAQMAVFLERGMNGSGYTPPAATGNAFLDVGAGDFAASFIEQLASDGITAGCGNNNYCPSANVTRDQMAVFLLRAKYGSAYSPPAATGVFGDVDASHWAIHWIEQLAAEGITAGCGGGNYCPDAAVTRDQMAVFLVRIFGL